MNNKNLPVGSTVTLKEFSFTNTAGGTGLSNWKYNVRFEGVAVVTIIAGWHDYETGWRYIGRAINPALHKYLKDNANVDDQRVFFSEYKIAEDVK